MKKIKKIIAMATIVTSIIATSQVKVFADTNINSITTEKTVTSNVDFMSEYKKAQSVIKSTIATNDTNKDTIIDAVKNKIDSSIKITEAEKFSKVDATDESEGRISGKLYIENSKNTRELRVNLTIAKLGTVKTSDEKPVAEDYKIAKDDTIIKDDKVIKEDKITRLKMNIGGKIKVGETITANIVGFNANNERKELDPSKAEYVWYANSEVVGNTKTLKITDGLQGKTIKFDIKYDEPKTK